MRKYFALVLCFVMVAVSGCNYPETVGDFSSATDVVRQSFEDKDYFAKLERVSLSMEATINCITAYEAGLAQKSTKTQPVVADLYKILDIQNGSLYKLAVEPIDDLDGYLSDARLNIYFYVTSDKIYRVWSTIIENNALVEFYSDDELFTQVLDTEEKVINNSYLVYQQNELMDSLEGEEPGVHNCIEISDNQVSSKMWEVTSNGETYFYESFLWGLNRDLISYRSGFRSERDILYLDNISINNKP